MSLQELVEILNKQRLVEDMVHRQHEPEHALVEALVHRIVGKGVGMVARRKRPPAVTPPMRV